MQCWLISCNPGPMAQGLWNCVLMISSPLNIHSVTATLWSHLSQSLCLSPCVMTKEFIPLQVQISLGWVKDGKHQCGYTEAERGSREKKAMSGRNGDCVRRLGIGRSQTPPQHQSGLRISAAPILCFKPADVRWWPGCPTRLGGDACRAGASPGVATEVLQLIQPQYPAMMGTISCE